MKTNLFSNSREFILGLVFCLNQISSLLFIQWKFLVSLALLWRTCEYYNYYIKQFLLLWRYFL